MRNALALIVCERTRKRTISSGEISRRARSPVASTSTARSSKAAHRSSRGRHADATTVSAARAAPFLLKRAAARCVRPYSLRRGLRDESSRGYTCDRASKSAPRRLQLRATREEFARMRRPVGATIEISGEASRQEGRPQSGTTMRGGISARAARTEAGRASFGKRMSCLAL